MKRTFIIASLAALLFAGCGHHWLGKHKSYAGPAADRPFPLGQVSDSHWETQQTNGEAADFIFYDHEFRGSTAQLAPGGKKHLEQVALRLEHVPFSIVIEESPHNGRPELDQARRRTVVEQLARLGVVNAEERVVVANAFAEGITGIEAEGAYYNAIGGSGSNQSGFGRRFGGTGAFFR